MPNTNQILFIAMISILFALAIIGIYILINKASHRRRRLVDSEAQENQLTLKNKEIDMYQPVMIKQGHHIVQQTNTPPPAFVMMTPQKKPSKRVSLLEKIYGSRNISSPPFLPSAAAAAAPQRPSTIRPPSFLPMQENYSPPAYGDHRASTPIIITDTKQ